MKKLLIGSRALSFWFKNTISDKTDWDIVSETNVESGLVELHDINFLNNSKLERYTHKDDWVILNGEKIFVVNPIGLSLVKRSHLWRDLSFDKHITHYHKYLAKFKPNYSKEDCDFLEERISLTKVAFP